MSDWWAQNWHDAFAVGLAATAVSILFSILRQLEVIVRRLNLIAELLEKRDD